MPGLTLLGLLLYQDDKHTIEDLTYSFAPNKFSLLAKQIKELTLAVLCRGEKMTKYCSRATLESEDLSDNKLRTLEYISTQSLTFLAGEYVGN